MYNRYIKETLLQKEEEEDYMYIHRTIFRLFRYGIDLGDLTHELIVLTNNTKTRDSEAVMEWIGF